MVASNDCGKIIAECQLQFCKLLRSSHDALTRVPGICYAEPLPVERHDLHETGRAFRTGCLGIEPRFLVHDRGNQGRMNIVFLRRFEDQRNEMRRNLAEIITLAKRVGYVTGTEIEPALRSDRAGFANYGFVYLAEIRTEARSQPFDDLIGKLLADSIAGSIPLLDEFLGASIPRLRHVSNDAETEICTDAASAKKASDAAA